MTYSIRRTIRALAAPKHRLSCPSRVWNDGVTELHRRTELKHESGAFLLGREFNGRREISKFVYYDDLDPHCLDSGVVEFDGAGYGPLWAMCRTEGLMVVADVHVHPGRAVQSDLDRTNPMIATVGHVAIILPDHASGEPGAEDMGIYQFRGDYRWYDLSGRKGRSYFYIGFWG